MAATDAGADSAQLVSLPLSQLHPSPYQPRRTHSQTSIEELAVSLREVGLLEPVCVRPVEECTYEIIAGERRWRAAGLAGFTRILCRLFHVSADTAFVMAVTENLQRRSLAPLEEALAYQAMLDRGIARNRATIARLLGVNRPRITQRMKLLELDEGTQRRMQEHRDILTEYHGRLLWGVKTLADRHRIADEAIEGQWSGRQLKQRVDEYLRMREIDAWQLHAGGLPRTWSVSLPGFSVRINFLRADVYRALEETRNMVSRLEDLLTVDSQSTSCHHVQADADQGPES